LFEEIKKLAEREGVMFLRFEPVEELRIADCGLQIKRTLDVQPSKTLILDLRQSEDELLKRMHQKTRYNIRLAEKKGIKIFSGNVIYRLIEDYTRWIELFREQARKQKEAGLIYPFAFKILPGMVFRNSKPAVAGIHVISGKIKPGVEIINENGENVGKVESLQSEGKTLHEAGKGDEVAIAISRATIGRQISENETLYSAITQKGLAKILQNADMFSSEELELAKKLFEKIKSTDEEGN